LKTICIISSYCPIYYALHLIRGGNTVGTGGLVVVLGNSGTTGVVTHAQALLTLATTSFALVAFPAAHAVLA
jgi:hypothetical protein